MTSRIDVPISVRVISVSLFESIQIILGTKSIEIHLDFVKEASDFFVIYVGYIPTPLTVNKMVCFYFYHPGGAPRFS